MPQFRLATIGFTQKSAERFFGLVRSSGARRVIDVRLNNVSQLAAFAKRDDLAYFLRTICGVEYLHLPDLAPTREMLDSYKKEHKDWDQYEREFLGLMEDRKIEETVDPDIIGDGCLLCSENEPHHCHRRLVADYLRSRWGGIEVNHLM